VYSQLYCWYGGSVYFNQNAVKFNSSPNVIDEFFTIQGPGQGPGKGTVKSVLLDLFS